MATGDGTIQDVYITGNALADWSTESTQKQIMGSLGLIQADNNVMSRLLKLIAQKMEIDNTLLAEVKATIQETSNNTKNQTEHADAQSTKVKYEQMKGNQYLKSMLLLNKDLVGAVDDFKRSSIEQEKITQALIKQGVDQDVAERVAKNYQDHTKQISFVKEKLMAFASSAALLGKTTQEALNQAFSERHTMATIFRQKGLLAGMDAAGAGMIRLADTISMTNFTFGEATEFTRLFSQAVGVKGVESALNFSNMMASVHSADGMMQRFAMDFGQVAQISGEYLDSLRITGHLRDRDDASLKEGMEDFVDNVMMTSNVLKISMTEAAELMKKSLSPAQSGLLATLPGEMGDTLRATLQSLNVQGGPMGDALAMRLQAGSQQAFTYSQEFRGLNQTAMGREVLDFIDQAAGVYDNQGADSFREFMASDFDNFVKQLTGFAGQDAQRALQIKDPALAAMLGQLIELNANMSDAAKDMPDVSEADIAQMLSDDQKRRAAVLAENTINKMMENQISNIQQLTETADALAKQIATTLEEYKKAPEIIANIFTWIKAHIQKGFTWAITTGFENYEGTENLIKVQDGLQPLLDEHTNIMEQLGSPGKIIGQGEDYLEAIGGAKTDEDRQEAQAEYDEWKAGLMKTVEDLNILAANASGMENTKVLIDTITNNAVQIQALLAQLGFLNKNLTHN